MKIDKCDEFTRAYIECALWSSNDESDEAGGEPLDANYTIEDLADEAFDRMKADCVRFQKEYGELCTGCIRGSGKYSELEQAGHDFWLTRNGHGAGFWDGDWPQTGGRLTAACTVFGECNLYVGDDGKIYIY